MTRPEPDLHAREPGSFLEEVHSFEFWLRSVEGYLAGTSFGRREETHETALSPERRERLITVLCNYCLGELTALEGASGLVRLAPNRMCKVFLATQAADEARHVEVFTRRLLDLGVHDPESEIEQRAHPELRDFKGRVLGLVHDGRWEEALFAQNVILEAMEFAVFTRHLETADPVSAEILSGVLSDERRHMGFGENELGRRLGADPGLRTSLEALKSELDHRVLATFEGTLRELGLAADAREEVGRIYLEAVQRLGFPA
jgi:hypothetical protein